MPSSSSGDAPVELFSTSILSNHKVRSRHERYLSILTVKKIPFVYHDLASDEEAKSRWRRKARDPQIPGLLVHNEWRGTFDEFEEAVEFGELDLFLRIDAGKAVDEASTATAAPGLSSTQPVTTADSNGSIQSVSDEKPNPRAPSHSVKLLDRLAQPRAPSQNNLAPSLPFAPSGSGRRKEHDAESFLNSLGISDLNLTEEELNEILEEGKNDKAEDKAEDNGTLSASSNDERGNGKYPSSLGIGSAKPAVARTYIPSAEAGIKPLRLARMGDGSQKPSASTSSLRTTPSARFHTSHLSSKALAAEAQASISSRAFSSVKVREAVSRGDKLEDAFKSTRDASRADEKENVVGREDLDDLMASLGLSDIQMSEEEAEAFLIDGTIPTGLDMHGDRLGRAGSAAEKARSEAAARDVARKAKEKGYGSESSRPASIASSSGIPDPLEEQKAATDLATVDDSSTANVQATAIEPETSDKQEDKDGKSGLAEQVPSVAESESPACEVQNDEKSNEEIVAEADRPTDEDHEKVKLDADDSSARMDTLVPESSIEETPMQRSVDLPAISSDSDTTKGKSSTSSAATLLKVEVHAPSDDADPVPQGGNVQASEAQRTASSEATQSSSLDSVAKETEETVVDKADEVVTHTDDEASTKPAGILAGEGVNEDDAASILEEHTSEQQAKTGNDKISEVAEKEYVTASDGAPADEKAIAAEVSSTTKEEADSPPQEAVSLPPSKSLSPPLSPIPAAPSSKPTSPSIDKATLSPVLIQTSPSTSRGQLNEEALSPSRRAMDLPRSMSSNSSLSEERSTHSSSPRLTPSSPSNAEGSRSPKSPKSPMSVTKKIFGIGRRRSKREDQESDEDEEKTSSNIASSPVAGDSNNRSQKTLSMILREADEALNGTSDDEDEYGGSHDVGGAFPSDLENIGADNGMGAHTGKHVNAAQ